MKFLVFDNRNGLGDASKLILNWDSVKYIKPSNATTFFIELNSGANIELTLSTGNSSEVIDAINRVVKANPNTSVLNVNPSEVGGFLFSSITYTSSEAGVSGSNSVYVKPTGTASENGALLLAGLTEAIAKSTSTTVPGVDIAVNTYSGAFGNFTCEPSNPADWSSLTTGSPYEATFDPGDGGGSRTVRIQITGTIFPFNFDFSLQELDGSPIFMIMGTPDFPLPAITTYDPSTLIIAPGDYDIASDFILNDLVNVTSLTGQPDVNITGSNVKIQSGANNAVVPISIVGLNLVDKSIYIASNLSSLSFKNCIALGSSSFSIEPSGTGSIAGKFEDCIGAQSSFGGGVGVTASGLFIRCKVEVGISSGDAFGGKGSTSGRFDYCGGAETSADPSNPGGIGTPNTAFCFQGVTCGGFFYNCIAGSSSFASENTGATTAEFYNCIAGNQSFAYRNTNNSGKFYNCTAVNSGNQCFGSNPQGGDVAANALYYNCTAGTIAQSAVGSSSKFYNCHAKTNWGNYSAGNNGLAYNCSFGAFGGQNSPTGTGKYRNCLDSTLTIINQG